MNSSGEFKNEDFLYIKEKIFSFSGIYLSEKKVQLVRSRMQTFLKKTGLSSFEEFKSRLDSHNHEFIQLFINIMTTNKTEFFREPKHFDYMQDTLIPKWKRGGVEINIWCCATSTGEEPYSISLLLNDSLEGLKYKILASDIDTQVLNSAQNGVYSIDKKNEIPQTYHRYLVDGFNRASGWFKLSNVIHSCIDFRRHNLIENDSPSDKKFDLIFCRNVLIYFEKNTIRKLMKKLHLALKDDGILFIGHSESINGCSDLFKMIQPAVYSKVMYEK